MTDRAFIVYRDIPVAEAWDQEWQTQTIEIELACLADYPEATDWIFGVTEKAGRVLEAGCGLGRYLIPLHQKRQNVYGLDYSLHALRIVHSYDRAIPLVLGDVRSLPYVFSSFDVCLSLGVLEHIVEGPELGLAEAHRVLVNDGLLLITGPCYEINGLAKAIRSKRQLPLTVRRALRQVTQHMLHLIPEKTIEAIFSLSERKGLRGTARLRRLATRMDPHSSAQENRRQAFFEYHYSLKQMCDYVTQAGFKVERKGYFGVEANLWYRLPALRSSHTRSFRSRIDVARADMFNDSLTDTGIAIARLFQVLAPSACAMGWMILAQKKGR